MYLKNAWIKFLKVKNVILLFLGIFFTAATASNMAELTVYYFGDWYTIMNAESTLGSIALFLIGAMMIICSRGSRRLINDACFFSNYFEGDLNGYVDFAELAEVTGKTTAQIKSRIALMQLLYMKNFRVIKTEGYRYPEIIELYSKTVTCSCRSCGCWMEKRVYFTGMCPYCGSSDLTAQVVSGQRVYFINDNANRKPNNPDYYKAPALNAKRIAYAVGFGIALFFVLIFLIVFLNFVSNYYNEEYLRETLLSGRSYSSFELKSVLRKSAVIITVSNMLMLLLAEATAYPAALLFASYDKELFDLTIQAIILYSFAYLFIGYNTFSSAFFTGLNNGRVSATISFLRTVGFEIGSLILLPLIFGRDAIRLSAAVAEFITLIVAIIFIVANRKKYHYL